MKIFLKNMHRNLVYNFNFFVHVLKMNDLNIQSIFNALHGCCITQLSEYQFETETFCRVLYI